jgi:salicylate hydroxylase
VAKKQMSKKILIAGAGIGGLCAALALVKRGFKVALFEQTATLSDVGAGLQLSPNAMQVLNELGLGEQLLAHSFSPENATMRHYQSGAKYLSLPLGGQCLRRYGAEYLHIHRADLQQVLYQSARDCGVNITLNAQVSAYQQSAGGVQLSLANGEKIQGDVLLAADGLRSRIHTQMLGQSNAQFTGQVAWRGTLAADRLPKGLVQPNANLWVGPGRHFVSYYLRGGSLVNFVAVEERTSWTKESWHERGNIQQLRGAFTSWHPQVTEVLAATDECFLWALFDRPPLSKWVDGKVALLGDACHPMLPFLAQGAAMAIEDAYVLAAMLARYSDTATALQTYQAKRLPRTSKIQMMARANARLYHMSNGLEKSKLWALKLAAKVAPNLASRPLEPIYAYDVVKDMSYTRRP